MSHNTPLIIIGLMSGTSADGIDAAIIQTDGEHIERLGIQLCMPYQYQVHKAVSAARKNPADFLADPHKTQALIRAITTDHAQAVKAVMKQTELHIDLIGFHGQTVYHNPDIGRTIQLGDGQLLASLTQTPVIFDFREADMRAGGQGAPLAPIYHQILLRHAGIDTAACILNIGGVSNLSFISGNAPIGKGLIGFDTGPGNGMIDDVMQAEFSLPYDEGGRIAASGNVHQGLVDQMMEEPYFERKGPRSLDRASFNTILQWPAFASLLPADKIATLTAFAAASICHGIKTLPAIPSHIVLAGGGVHNHTLISMIKISLKTQTRFLLAQDIDADSDFIEAELIAVLAARHHYGLASTFPQTTGVSSPQICGRLAPPR